MNKRIQWRGCTYTSDSLAKMDIKRTEHRKVPRDLGNVGTAALQIFTLKKEKERERQTKPCHDVS